MTERKSFIAAGLVVVFLLTGFSVSSAAERDGLRLDLGYAKIGRLLEFKEFAGSLNLTADQKTRIREILRSNREPMRQTIRMVIQARLDILKQAPNAGEELANALVQASSLKKQLWEQIGPMLTEEQLAGIKEKRQSREKRLQGFLDRIDARMIP